MPSAISSQGSLTDAEDLARRLGIVTWTVPITSPFEEVSRALHDANGSRPRPFTGLTSTGVAEENLQARLRGMYLMACSNKFGGIVLTTGNKSELTMGYCTLGGDMAGGFAPLADCEKTLVYRLAKWRNRAAMAPAAPIPEASITKAPSAELSPGQADSDSLPPYELLDRVVGLYVDQRQGPREMVATLQGDQGFMAAASTAGLGLSDLHGFVAEIVRRIDANEYKRRLGAPCIRVSGRAWGRDRRMPITNKWAGAGHTAALQDPASPWPRAEILLKKWPEARCAYCTGA